MNIFSIRSSFLLTLAVPAVFTFAQEPAGQEEFRLMTSESIGGIKIGTSEKELPALVKGNPIMSRVRTSEIDGQLHQTWIYNGFGIKLDMIKENQKDQKHVYSIDISAPCLFSTRQGIQIGSSESEVIKAYKKDYNRHESKKGQVAIVGSIYGGLIFEIKNNKVFGILLGPGAE